MTDVVTFEDTQILVEQADGSVLVSEEQLVEVLAVAEQGPRGIQGPPGPAGGAMTVTVGAQALSGHSVVSIDAAGLLVKADCTVATQRGAVVGLLANAYAPGDQAVVQTAFTLEHAGWSWVPGPVFVGAGGLLTQSVPPGAVFSQVVAHALAPTLVLVEVQPPIAIA